MARQLRIEYPGAWYHVTARGNERKPLFRADGDRRHFLDLVEESGHRHRLRMHSYALMDNHYHLLVETEVREGMEANPWEGLVGQKLLGGGKSEEGAVRDLLRSTR